MIWSRYRGVGALTERVALRGYDTTLDRAGLALGAGGLMGGTIASVLVALGGPPSLLGIVVGFVVGAVITAMTVIAVAGPLWLAAHAFGRRGPGSAALIGAIAGFALFLGGQTYGFGLFTMPPTDARALLFRWISAAATSLILAAVAAAIGLVMWRVAYRRVGTEDRR